MRERAGTDGLRTCEAQSVLLIGVENLTLNCCWCSKPGWRGEDQTPDSNWSTLNQTNESSSNPVEKAGKIPCPSLEKLYSSIVGSWLQDWTYSWAEIYSLWTRRDIFLDGPKCSETDSGMHSQRNSSCRFLKNNKIFTWWLKEIMTIINEFCWAKSAGHSKNF